MRGLTVRQYGGFTASKTVSEFAIGDKISITTDCQALTGMGVSIYVTSEFRTGNGTKIEGQNYQVKGVNDDNTLTLEVTVHGRPTGSAGAH
jgi:ribosomal protein L21E